jgi:hypothetical protein
METPRRDPPSNVIALSPFRAELGRGRRLRRADVLFDAPDVGAAVRALPGDELYYVLHEVGLREGAGLLAFATAEQLQVALDFGLWERDRVVWGSLDEWLEAMSTAPVERIGDWLAGLDSELVGLILRRSARIYDLSQEAPPDEPEGTFYPTPDRLFVLDVTGPTGETSGPPGTDEERDPAATVIRLIDALYRADRTLARRILIGARGELDAELEETAYRWRQARMSDLGFQDYYDALEVYRELDPASVWIDESAGAPAARPRGPAAPGGDALRVPTALAERLGDTAGSPFARAAQKLGDPRAIEELRLALVALTNRVLAADRVAPGDDEAVAAVLDRLAATLDLALERLAGADDARGAEALRALPLVRLFRLGFSLTARVRKLALALRRHGPFGAGALALAEPDDAAVLEAVTAARPMFPRLLDEPPHAGERPFRTLADLARAAAAVERAAIAQAMLRGLGVRAEDLAPDAPALAAAGGDEAAIDTGVVARTALVPRLLARGAGAAAPAFRALDPKEVKAFEALLRPARGKTSIREPSEGSRRTPPGKPSSVHAPTLPTALAKRATELLEAAAPRPRSDATTAVIQRWVRTLAPLEPVLVVATQPRPRSGRRRV